VPAESVVGRSPTCPDLSLASRPGRSLSCAGLRGTRKRPTNDNQYSEYLWFSVFPVACFDVNRALVDTRDTDSRSQRGLKTVAAHSLRGRLQQGGGNRASRGRIHGVPRVECADAQVTETVPLASTRDFDPVIRRATLKPQHVPDRRQAPAQRPPAARQTVTVRSQRQQPVRKPARGNRDRPGRSGEDCGGCPFWPCCATITNNHPPAAAGRP
jgi:hypothetical protein